MEAKVLLIGDSGVGKTTFVNYHLKQSFSKKYYPTQGAQISQVRFKTNYGPIKYTLWDCAGNSSGYESWYYQGADAAIIFFDLSDRESYRSVPHWYREVRRLCGNIRVILCGTKFDLSNKKIIKREVNFHRRKGLQYYQISSKDEYQLDKPFLYLSRGFMGNKTRLL